MEVLNVFETIDLSKAAELEDDLNILEMYIRKKIKVEVEEGTEKTRTEKNIGLKCIWSC